MTTAIFAPHQPQTIGEKRIVEILFVLSLIAIVTILIFYFITPNPSHIIGNQLVNNPNGGPEEFPSPSISPLYAKPITYLFAAGIVFGYCFFALGRRMIEEKIPRSLQTLLLIISVLLFGVGIYEVFFNFTLWSAVMARNPNVDPDTAVNMWPINSLQINLAYATKMSLLWAIVAFFSVMTFKSSLESITTLNTNSGSNNKNDEGDVTKDREKEEK
jgi:cytochrome c biogenesis protein CcdA